MDFGKLSKAGSILQPRMYIPVGRPIKPPKICETNTMVINVLHPLLYEYCVHTSDIVVSPADVARGISIFFCCQDFVILTSAY